MSEAVDGLARERTRLAWRRTALGLAAGSIGAGKLLEEVVGPAAWTLTLAGLLASTLVLVTALRRHTVVSPVQHGGRLVAVVAVSLGVLGALALALVVTGNVTLGLTSG